MRFPLRIPEKGHRGSTVGQRIKEPVLSPLLSLLLSKTTGGV